MGRVVAFDRHTWAIVRGLGLACLVAVACAAVFDYSITLQRLDDARRELAAAHEEDAREDAALKFFELQSTLGVLDLGDAPAGIAVRAPAVRALAARLKTPSAAFAFVSRKIAYTMRTGVADIRADHVLARRVGNCQGKANLLAALLRDMGTPASGLRVAYAEVLKRGMPAAHAWLELKADGRWRVMDTTPYLASSPGIFEAADYYRRYAAVPVVYYTDEGLDFTVP